MHPAHSPLSWAFQGLVPLLRASDPCKYQEWTLQQLLTRWGSQLMLADKTPEQQQTAELARGLTSTPSQRWPRGGAAGKPMAVPAACRPGSKGAIPTGTPGPRGSESPEPRRREAGPAHLDTEPPREGQLSWREDKAGRGVWDKGSREGVGWGSALPRILQGYLILGMLAGPLGLRAHGRQAPRLGPQLQPISGFPASQGPGGYVATEGAGRGGCCQSAQSPWKLHGRGAAGG